MQSPKSEKEKRRATVLRINQSVYDKLNVIAQEENRSVNQQIVYYINKALAAKNPQTNRF